MVKRPFAITLARPETKTPYYKYNTMSREESK